MVYNFKYFLKLKKAEQIGIKIKGGGIIDKSDLKI